MSAGAQVDYEALAKKYGGAPAADYDAIAKKYGGSAIPLAPTGNAGTQEHPLVTPKPGEDFASTMRRGVEMGKQVTPEQIKTAKWEAIKDVPTVMSVAALPGLVTGLGEAATAGSMRAAMPSLLKMGRGLIGAGVGAGVGSRAGSAIGGHFGETGAQVGGILGSIGGGMAGGGLAAGLERRPATSLQSLRGEPGSIPPMPLGIQRAIPEWLIPRGELGTPTNPGPFSDIPSRMPKLKTIDIPPELGSPENPGWVTKLPDRMPARIPELGSPENPGWMSKLPTRMPQATVPPAPLGSSENPGWLAKLPDRMPIRKTPFELGTPENPGWMAPIPNRMPTIRAPQGLTPPQLVGEVGGGIPRAPSPSEENITNLIRKRIVTPEEAARETSELGQRAPRKPGEGLMEREARLLGETRARRASKGMKEPE